MFTQKQLYSLLYFYKVSVIGSDSHVPIVTLMYQLIGGLMMKGRRDSRLFVFDGCK